MVQPIITVEVLRHGLSSVLDADRVVGAQTLADLAAAEQGESA